MSFAPELDATRRAAIARLLAARNAEGCWTGRLASSALATATAAFALWRLDRRRDLAEAGFRWIAAHQNPDGGWGDTPAAKSNISTTLLCWSALAAWPAAPEAVTRRAEVWIVERAGSLQPAALVAAVERRYGEDRTFSVPILTMATLAGRLGTDAWRHIAPLPFELAALPQWTFRLLRLPVVSYALPALIAMGMARCHAAPPANPLLRVVRRLARRPALKRLTQIQPPGGGFLEAAPLTSFVAMTLATVAPPDHPVLRAAVEFLVRSVRDDGSWPIDTNLSTWSTTLAVGALAAGGRLRQYLDEEARRAIRRWLLGQQYRTRHPYTGAAPGGWAWTDLDGGVPDADDTSGALLALHHLRPGDDDAPGQAAIRAAAAAGVRWLLGLQNRDGGVPTFCRGWGRLPFDRSSTDITAHALRAIRAWHGELPATLARRADRAADRAARFLAARQQPAGSWLPLWFGNEHHPDEENPTYGTSRVLLALTEDAATARASHSLAPLARGGVAWLLRTQGDDGGWSGEAGLPPSIEETALAVEALAAANPGAEVTAAIHRGAEWLARATARGRAFPPSPIGFYFAKLWYHEEIYPLVFTVAALERAARRLGFEVERGRE